MSGPYTYRIGFFDVKEMGMMLVQLASFAKEASKLIIGCNQSLIANDCFLLYKCLGQYAASKWLTIPILRYANPCLPEFFFIFFGLPSLNFIFYDFFFIYRKRLLNNSLLKKPFHDVKKISSVHSSVFFQRVSNTDRFLRLILISGFLCPSFFSIPSFLLSLASN